MPVGANIKYTTRKQVVAQIFQLLGMKGTKLVSLGVRGQSKFCFKAGVPVANTAADNPNQLYDILLDTTNHRVYVCTLYSADASATTWTRIV